MFIKAVQFQQMSEAKSIVADFFREKLCIETRAMRLSTTEVSITLKIRNYAGVSVLKAQRVMTLHLWVKQDYPLQSFSVQVMQAAQTSTRIHF
jgi:hypothetical protein